MAKKRVLQGKLAEKAKSVYYRAVFRLRKDPERRAAYKTGNWESAAKFGSKFLSSFPITVLRGKKRKRFLIRMSLGSWEASNEVRLSEQPVSDRNKYFGELLARVRTGFTKKAVIIESMQGVTKQQPTLERFREMHGKPWANYLIELIENHARKQGFEEVKIRIPESLYYYQHPLISEEFESIMGNKVKKKAAINMVRKRMVKLYYGVAETRGYEKKRGFLVKKL